MLPQSTLLHHRSPLCCATTVRFAAPALCLVLVARLCPSFRPKPPARQISLPFTCHAAHSGVTQALCLPPRATALAAGRCYAQHPLTNPLACSALVLAPRHDWLWPFCCRVRRGRHGLCVWTRLRMGLLHRVHPGLLGRSVRALPRSPLW